MQQVREWLNDTMKVVVFTGGGIAAASSGSTFRGGAGPWKQFSQAELATPAQFAANPLRVWELFQWRRGLMQAAGPSPVHLAIAELGRRKMLTVITQNVDSLHEQSGSGNVIKLNGDIWRMRCTQCNSEWIDRRVPMLIMPPVCQCGAVARPGIVMFSESAPPEIWKAADKAVRDCKVFLMIGVEAVIHPAATLVPMARKWGARIVEIAPEETGFTEQADASLRGSPAEVLTELMKKGE